MRAIILHTQNDRQVTTELRLRRLLDTIPEIIIVVIAIAARVTGAGENSGTAVAVVLVVIMLRCIALHE